MSNLPQLENAGVAGVSTAGPSGDRMETSFLSREEIQKMGFRSVGENCLISRFSRFYGASRMAIGDHVRIDDFCVLSGRIEIGNHVHVAAQCSLFGGDDLSAITLHDFSGLSGRTTIYARSDDYSGNWMTNPTVPEHLTHVVSKPVSIGRHAIVGAGSVILPGVSLGDGAALGAMSLATKSIPDSTIHSGIPARRVRRRAVRLFELERELTP